MPRQLRLEYEGAIYHVMSRGDRREDIFLEERDWERFLETLGETCRKTDWQVHAYCLMRNHFHLVVETPKANLSKGMHWFLGTCTARFNRRHKMSGHLFSGRYKSLLVDGSGTGYLKSVCDYVHLNPVRAQLLQAGQPLQDYRWSSYPGYLTPPSRRPGWLRTDRLLGEWRILSDKPRGRQEFQKAMEDRKKQVMARKDDDWTKLRRGWCWGAEGFREELLEMIAQKQGNHHHGGELRESALQKAERLLEEMLEKAGIDPKALPGRRKGDRSKIRMAVALRAQTTMPWKWIAEKLAMGHWRTAANAVRLAK